MILKALQALQKELFLLRYKHRREMRQAYASERSEANVEIDDAQYPAVWDPYFKLRAEGFRLKATG